jgi:hypothetical protein
MESTTAFMWRESSHEKVGRHSNTLAFLFMVYLTTLSLAPTIYQTWANCSSPTACGSSEPFLLLTEKIVGNPFLKDGYSVSLATCVTYRRMVGQLIKN